MEKKLNYFLGNLCAIAWRCKYVGRHPDPDKKYLHRTSMYKVQVEVELFSEKTTNYNKERKSRIISFDKYTVHMHVHQGKVK